MHLFHPYESAIILRHCVREAYAVKYCYLTL